MHFLSIPLNCALFKLEYSVNLTGSRYPYDATSKLFPEFYYSKICMMGSKKESAETLS